ncbi:MAG: antitoxin [Zetaproteobacteria bacterium]|nr:MAG: antitoxin [Zetaproteobacteria bacterium]
MQSKLTLRLEDDVIKQAKIYAKAHQTSLSKVVADYFQVLTMEKKTSVIPPITRSLVGVLNDADIDLDDYKQHLEKKYL